MGLLVAGGDNTKAEVGRPSKAAAGVRQMRRPLNWMFLLKLGGEIYMLGLKWRLQKKDLSLYLGGHSQAQTKQFISR